MNKVKNDASYFLAPLSEQDDSCSLHEISSGPISLHELVCDENGECVDFRFIEVNAAFEKMSGQRADLLLGKSFSSFFPDLDSYFIEVLAQVARTQKSFSLKRYIERLDRYFEIHISSSQKGKVACLFKAEVKPRPARILVVDDEDGICLILEQFLLGLGMEVEKVTSGQKALELMQLQDFDLIFTDMAMPGMTGHEFVLQAKINFPGIQTPFVCLSGLNLLDEEESLFDAGLSKPFDFEQLSELLNKYIKKV